MLTDGFDVYWHARSLTRADARACLERVLETGCVADPYRRSNSDATPPSVEDVLAEAEETDGHFQFYYDDYTTISVSADWDETTSWTEPKLGFHLVVDGTAGFDYETEKAMDHERLALLRSIGSDLIEVVEPEYGWSTPANAINYINDVHPSGRPVTDHVDRIGWLTVMGPSVIGEFGGLERLHGAPAARFTEYDTGHVLLQKTDPYFDAKNPALESFLLGDQYSRR